MWRITSLHYKIEFLQCNGFNRAPRRHQSLFFVLAAACFRGGLPGNESKSPVRSDRVLSFSSFEPHCQVSWLLRRVGPIEKKLLHTDTKGKWWWWFSPVKGWFPAVRAWTAVSHAENQDSSSPCMAYTYPFPPELSSRIFGCGDTWPGQQERQSRVWDLGWIMLGIAERVPGAPSPPWVRLGQTHSSVWDQTHHSCFFLYLAHQPHRAADSGANLPSGQGWDFTSEHVQSSGW